MIASMAPWMATTAPVLLVRDGLASRTSGPRGIAHDDAEKAVGVDLVLELAQETVERANQR